MKARYMVTGDSVPLAVVDAAEVRAFLDSTTGGPMAHALRAALPPLLSESHLSGAGPGTLTIERGAYLTMVMLLAMEGAS